MPYLPTAQSWLHQSTLLLQARPTTTRITTKYTIQPSRPAPAPAPAAPTNSTPAPPKAHLILKTYDPASGACLKYRTDKAAEVGRLIAALARCGRVMAAVPERVEGEEGQTVEKMGGEGEGTTGWSTSVVEGGKAGEKGKGGGGRKKKGRK